MVKVGQVLDYCYDLARRGVGVDQDGRWGAQCVDLINGVGYRFFRTTLPGNAIDLLNSARARGFKTYGADHKPLRGAVFVAQSYTHSFGHTGIVVENYTGGGVVQTIEQNVDGNGGIGGPARRKTSPLSDGGGRIVGYFYFPYEDLGGDYNPSNGSTVIDADGWDKWKDTLMALHFTFHVTGDDKSWPSGAIYYYNGAINEVQVFHNPEELEWLRKIWKETHGNRELKHYEWTNQAPVYVRLFGTLRPGSQNSQVLDQLKKILAEIDKGV